MPRDDRSILTVVTEDEPPKSADRAGTKCSEGRYEQLARARKKALVNRQRAAATRLEAKLEDLHRRMGPLRQDQSERVMRTLMENEAALREKQRVATDQMRESLERVNAELRDLRKRAEKRGERRPPPPSTVGGSSSVVSG